MFESRQQRLKEKDIYYTGLPGQFEDGEAMYEVDIPTNTEEQGTDQYQICLLAQLWKEILLD